MFHFRLDDDVRVGRIDLARPDGVVIEVVMDDAVSFSITPAQSDLAIAIVRRR